MGDPGLAADPRFATQDARTRNRDALTALIEDLFTTMTSAAVAELLERHGIANGRLNDPLAAWDHPQFAARDKWREVMTEKGPVRALLPPFQFTDFRGRHGRRSRRRPAHRRRAGGTWAMTASAIAALRETGAI